MGALRERHKVLASRNSINPCLFVLPLQCFYTQLFKDLTFFGPTELRAFCPEQVVLFVVH
jgi:hypothetical protein